MLRVSRFLALAVVATALCSVGGGDGTAGSGSGFAVVDRTEQGPLSLDEDAIRARCSGSDLVVTLPVVLAGDEPLAVVASIRSWDVAERPVQLLPGPNAVDVTLSGVPSHVREAPQVARLRWSVLDVVGGSEIEGVRSLALSLPTLRLLVALPARLVAGEPVHYNATVTNEPDGTAAVGASVSIAFNQGWGVAEDALLSQAVADETGTVTGVLGTLSTAGTALLTAAAELGERAAQLQTYLSVEEPREAQGRILLRTDKPRYQPGQTVHLRALALRSGDRLPAVGETLTFSFRDPRGTRVHEEQAVVDAFGVAHVTLPLADELLLGTYDVETRGAGLAARTGFDVDRYELPRFRPSVSLDRPYASPDGEIAGTVDVRYVFGAPVKSAAVRVELLRDEIDATPHDTARARTRGDGTARFRVRVPPHFASAALREGTAAVHLRVTATDSAGLENTETLRVPISSGALRVRVVPEAGHLIAGAPNRLHLIVTDPEGRPVAAACDVALDGVPLGAATTDAQGHALLVTTALPAGDVVTVHAAALDDGRTATSSLDLPTQAADGFLLARPERALVRAGEDVTVDLLSSAASGSVTLDLSSDGRVRASATTTLVDGAGSAVLTSPADLLGEATIAARVVDADGRVHGDRRRIVLDLGAALDVSVTPDREAYAPGDDAELTFEVRDRAGSGVPAEIGVTVVDEAVYLLTGGQAGSEGLELASGDLDGSESLGSGVTLGDLLSGERTPEAQDLAAAILAGTSARGAVLDSRAFLRDAEIGEVLGYVFGDDFESVRRLVRRRTKRERRRLMRKRAFPDPWGTPYRISIEGHPRELFMASAGPDERFGTDDDIEVRDRIRRERRPGGAVGFFDGPILFDLDTPRFGDDLTFGGAGQGQDGGLAPTPNGPESGGGEPARVRSFFPETLLALPDLLTDAQGTARLPLRLADSITTWRVAALASSESGALGSGTAQLTATQELFVDLGLPRELTVGDRIEIPVVAFNLTDAERDVRVTLEPAPWYATDGASARDVTVAAGSAARATFVIDVLAAGENVLQARASGGGLADAVEMTTTVAPDARPVTFTRGGQIVGTVTETVDVPQSAFPDLVDLHLRILPGVVSQSLDGLDGLLQEPHGCFEQTSSSTYPNALILDYLRATGTVDPDVEARAKRYLTTGLQRLLTFETGDGGGFSYWGDPPANLVITSFALREFTDIGKVRFVDPALIDRIASWIVSRQGSDGAWRSQDGGSATRYDSEPLRVTAYVAWALVDAGRSGPAVQKALDFVRAHVGTEQDLYTRVICANALLAGGTTDTTGLAVLSDVVAERRSDESGTWWAYGSMGYDDDFAVGAPIGRGITSAGGAAADVEVTALATHAMLAGGGYDDIVSDALKHLAGARTSWGWGGTHGTVWTLKAFLAVDARGSAQAGGRVTVTVNGQPAGTLDLGAGDVARDLDLSDLARLGSNVVELAAEGGEPFYRLSGGWVVPWSVEPSEPEALEVDVALSPKRIRKGRRAGLTLRVRNRRASGRAEMVTAVVGLPPGCAVDESTLRRAVEVGDIERFEVQGNRVNVYLPGIAEGAAATVELDVYPTLEGELRVPHTRAFEYYDPDSQGVAPPITVRVR